VARMRNQARRRTQGGAVFPSPVVILTVLAVAMAAVAFVATRGGEPAEREVTTVGKQQPKETPAPSYSASATPTPKAPPVQRGKVYVEVFNNSGITGLAGRVATKSAGMGWKVVGSDNWYGTVPATTVYYPKGLKRAAKTLALDLGIQRTAPAVDPMRHDRLTLILTGPLH
jgi:LytR cell envelope-related transcriptional attenuator